MSTTVAFCDMSTVNMSTVDKSTVYFSTPPGEGGLKGRLNNVNKNALLANVGFPYAQPKMFEISNS